MKKGELRKVYFWIISIVILIILAYLVISNMSPKNQSQISLTFPISWYSGPQYAYVYVAQEKGFFAEEGLNVTITENLGSGITSQLVASGQASIGMVAADIAMTSASKGLPLTVVAIADKVNPSGITCFTSANISKPIDLYGKKLGVTITSNSYQAYLAFAKKVGLDRSKISEIPISGAGTEWLAGKTDCQVLYPFLSVPAAESKGLNVTHLDFADYGLEMYNQALVANSKVVEENPELIHKITRAFCKGVAYERAHPEEALNISMLLNPQLNAKLIYETKVFELRMDLDKKLNDPSTAGDCLIDQHTLENMKDTLGNLSLLQSEVNLNDFFTDRFIK